MDELRTFILMATESKKTALDDDNAPLTIGDKMVAEFDAQRANYAGEIMPR